MSVERGGLSPKAKEVVESISRDRLGLRESVRDLAPEQMDFRPAPGSWSIDDVLHHLALAEEASAKLMAFLHERALKESVGPDPAPGSNPRGAESSKASNRSRPSTAESSPIATPSSASSISTNGFSSAAGTSGGTPSRSSGSRATPVFPSPDADLLRL